MQDGAILFIVIGFIVLAIIIRVLAGGMDHDRVGRYVRSHGGRLIKADWAPFGKGWFGEKNDRIYEVRYVDGDGNEHQASCKTSALSGVYFTDDRIVKYASRPEDGRVEDLEAENRRLREELERLRDERQA